MRRILLVLEDYNELLFLETLLKKVGFDVDSIRNESSLTEKMLEFPDLAIATGDGYKVNGIRVSKKVKKKGAQVKLLLLFPRQKLPEPIGLDTAIVDGVAESPLNPRHILTVICELTGIVTETILSKFEKLPIAKDFPAREEIQIVSARKTAPSVANMAPPSAPATRASAPRYERHAKYAELLKNVPPSPLNGFKKAYISNELSEIRKNGESEEIKKLDEERKEFVKALFKK